MRKNILCMIACVVISFFLFACSSSDPLLEQQFHTDAYLPSYDMQNSFGLLSATCETEEAYYFSSIYGHYIWYVNKETGEYGKLCGNPQCKHDGAGCNAYMISSPMSGLSLYEERIYWTSNPTVSSSDYYLFSMNLDGTDRRQEQKLPGLVDGGNPMMRVHRGYVYTAVLISDVENGVPIEALRLTQAILGKEDSAKTIFEHTHEAGPIGYEMQLYGNVLYFLYSYEAQSTLYAYSIEDASLKTLYEEQDINRYAESLWVDESGVYWLESELDTERYTIMRYDSQEGMARSIHSIEGTGITMGGQKLVQYNSVERGFFCWIGTYDGVTLREDEILVTEQPEKPGCNEISITTDCVLFQLMWQEGAETVGALVRVPFDVSEEAQVLCRFDIP